MVKKRAKTAEVAKAPESEAESAAALAQAGGIVAVRAGEVEAPRFVVIESPYAGVVEMNVAYARACMADCLARGEIPLASHLLYTQPGVLNDRVEAERDLGIEAGLAWGCWTNAATVVYSDLGVTEGMLRGISRAQAEGRRVENRELGSAATEAVIAKAAAENRELLTNARLADTARRLRPMGVKCTGCGSAWDDDRLEAERGKRPGLVSCCPERDMIEVFAVEGGAGINRDALIDRLEAHAAANDGRDGNAAVAKLIREATLIIRFAMTPDERAQADRARELLAVADDAVGFIEWIKDAPILDTDDREMNLDDVQSHAAIEWDALCGRLGKLKGKI